MAIDIAYSIIRSLECEKEENMKILNFKTKSFRKIPNPFYNIDNYMDNSEMYIMICDVKDIPKDIPMDTNPREQKLTTAVAKKIRTSLINERSNNFYLLNRGLTISAKSVKYDNKNDLVTIEFEDNEVHGDIDGGHTYKIILEEQGYTQNDFAEECQISRAYYGRIERGEHSITIETCEKICKTLGITLKMLFENT